MRRSRAIGAAAGGVIILLAGYTTLDVYDVVPGVLTLQSAKQQPVPEPGQTTAPRTTVDAPSAPALPAALAALNGPQQLPTKVAAALKSSLASNSLPATVGVSVHDARTGTSLFEQQQNTPMEPASITKLVSAWGVSQVMKLEKPLTTKVVDAGDGHISLVAGGDVLLSPGKGNPSATVGHAGLDDLATQVAAKLNASGRHTVTVDTDTSYAPGSLTAPDWPDGVLEAGYTTRIAMLGLSTQKADDKTPAVADPVASATKAFVAALGKHGITATTGTQSQTKAHGATLGSVDSAPLVDVLGVALQDSDNSMTDGLIRQAAFSQGVKGDFPSITAWLIKLLQDKGFDTAGVHMVDGSGLSSGTRIPPRLFAALLTSATTGKDNKFEQAISRLSVSAWNGTLDDRFQQQSGSAAAGWVRAKTGSLAQVSSLAGTLVTDDKRLLTFVVIANGNLTAGRDNVRAAIDAVAASLVKCGCS